MRFGAPYSRSNSLASRPIFSQRNLPYTPVREYHALHGDGVCWARDKGLAGFDE
jgi:hypothetical protein